MYVLDSEKNTRNAPSCMKCEEKLLYKLGLAHHMALVG